MFTRIEIPVGSLVPGTPLSVVAFRFEGQGDHPSAYIQANIHADELQGIGVAYRLMCSLSENPPLGDVTIVPNANPFGATTKMGEYTYGRFNPITGSNWNRHYWNPVRSGGGADDGRIPLGDFVAARAEMPTEQVLAEFRETLRGAVEAKRADDALGRSPEDRLALCLQTMALEADVVFDLHTASHATRYVYAPEYAKDKVRHLGIPRVLLIPNEFSGALDEVASHPWWTLSEAFEAAGRKDVPVAVDSFTMELGGQEKLDLDAARDDAACVMSYLAHAGVVSGESRAIDCDYCRLADYQTVHAPRSGWVHFRVEPGSRVKEGDVLAEFLSFRDVESAADLDAALTPVQATADGIVLTRFASSAVTEGAELMKLMTRPC